MPNPKRRHSKSRRNKRRTHDALRAPQTVTCPNCQAPIQSHRMCPKCGHYKGREIIAMGDKWAT
jgi:large subunit ribosomal protein L32